MSKRPSYKDLGFWRSLSRMRIGELLGAWDFWSALLIAVLGSVFYVRSQASVLAHVSIAGDFLSIGAALFGVVLAGLAIVAALLGDRYAKFLRSAGSTSLDVLSQFVVVAGLLVASIVATVMYRAAAEPISRTFPVVEQIAFGLACFLFLWSLFASLQLVKLIFGLAVSNVELSLLSSDEPTPGSGSRGQASDRR
jgi:hypothetical protein